MRNTLNEEKLKAVFTADETKTVEEASKEGVQWLESNPDADADAIEGKQKQLEAKFNPIMMRVYQAAGGPAGGMPGMGGMPGGPMGGAGGATDAGVDDLD